MDYNRPEAIEILTLCIFWYIFSHFIYIYTFDIEFWQHFSHSELFTSQIIEIRQINFDDSTDGVIDDVNNNLVQRVMQ